METICFSEECDGKLIVIDRTGSGKSHILRMVATMTGGIILVIVPLLSLTADQMAKIRVALMSEGSVEAHHADEIPTELLNEIVIPRMHEIGYNSTSTMFIFTSPQKLANTQPLLDALFTCHQNQTLRLVTIDEAHLYAQHGRSFRESLRVLTSVFFTVLFRIGHWHPLFLAMTATMTMDLLPLFSELTTVDWSLPCHQMWSDWYDFQQRNIVLNFEVVDHMGRAYPTLTNHLKEQHPDASSFVFVNFRSECETVSKAIEDMIIQQRLPFDHLVVHGHQDKHKKIGYISLFNGSLVMENFLAQILISTAAANTGIDKDTIEMVLRKGVPRDLITLFQE